MFVDTSTNSTQMAHPMHVHGYHFIILKQGFATDRANPNLEKENFIIRKNVTVADTVSIPPFGYVVLRLKITNPGKFYLFFTTLEKWRSSRGGFCSFKTVQMQDSIADFRQSAGVTGSNNSYFIQITRA